MINPITGLSGSSTSVSHQKIQEAIKDIGWLKQQKFDYIQIFGIFASILTLVGAAGSKQFTTSAVLLLGSFQVLFCYMLFWIPKFFEKDEGERRVYINSVQKKLINFFWNKWWGYGLLTSILVLGFLVGRIGLDKSTNIGLCNTFGLQHIEIRSEIYCGTGYIPDFGSGVIK